MSDTEYSRGRESGTTETRLEGHDDRLHAINGNIAKFAQEMSGMNLLLQSVRDTVKAGADAAIATAAALEKADVARRKQDDAAWAPITKLFAGIAALSSAAAAYLALFRH